MTTPATLSHIQVNYVVDLTRDAVAMPCAQGVPSCRALLLFTFMRGGEACYRSVRAVRAVWSGIARAAGGDGASNLCACCAATITRRVNDIVHPTQAWETVRGLLAFHDKIVEEEQERHARLHGSGASAASPPASNERPKLRTSSSTPPSVTFKLD